ncbi:MAG: acyltransferase [Rhizobacter sp.]|nr:acyltransferase [Rhizobacter sp.]
MRAGEVDRQQGLDRLKAGLTLLVVFHHTSITYGGAGGWFYRELSPGGSPSSTLLTFFCAINQAYFMGLFFFLAGVFTPHALQHKSAARFLGDRFVRLGIPLLVFGWGLGPMTIALVQSTLHERSFFEVLLSLWQRGVFEQGPLWFAKALLVMALVSLIVHRMTGWPREAALPFPSNLQLLAAALVCGLAAFALRLVWPVGTEFWGLQLGYFASYVILYIAGNLAGQNGWLAQMPGPQVRRWRRIAWCTLPLLAPLGLLAHVVPIFQASPTGGWNLPALMYAFWEPFVAWGVILLLLARAQRPSARASPLWQRLSRRAYAIYVIHPLPVVAIALAWRQVSAPALLKFVVTGSLACVVCYAAAGLLLRLPGVRRVL